MNPYLRLDTPIPASTYVYAQEFLEAAWPELEPVSSTKPIASWKVIKENSIGTDVKAEITSATADIGIFAGDAYLGQIKIEKVLNIQDGVFHFAPIDTEAADLICYSDLVRWDHNLCPQLLNFASEWQPSEHIDRPVHPDALSGAILDTILYGDVKRFFGIKTPDFQVIISYAFWPWKGPFVSHPTLYFGVWTSVTSTWTMDTYRHLLSDPEEAWAAGYQMMGSHSPIAEPSVEAAVEAWAAAYPDFIDTIESFKAEVEHAEESET